MTTRIEMQKRTKRIRELVLKGYTARYIARKLKISVGAVYSILNVLTHTGDLVRVPNSSPAVYTDPHAHPIMQIGTNEGEVVIFDEPIQDYLPEGAELPSGYVNCHISGFIFGNVRVKGEFVTVYKDDKPVVSWEGPKAAGKGLTMWTCHMHFWSQDFKVDYFEGSHGKTFVKMYLRRIYVDPAKVNKTRRYEYFMERARYLAQVLRAKGGWQIDDLQMKGKFHYGKENDPLAQFIPKNSDTDDKDIITDTSPGIVETEMEHLDDLPEDTAEKLLKIYANIPSELLKQRDGIEANSSEITKLIASNHAQRTLLAELQATVNLQSTIISGLTANLTKLTEATAQLTTLGTAQVQKDIATKTNFNWEGYI